MEKRVCGGEGCSGLGICRLNTDQPGSSDSQRGGARLNHLWKFFKLSYLIHPCPPPHSPLISHHILLVPSGRMNLCYVRVQPSPRCVGARSVYSGFVKPEADTIWGALFKEKLQNNKYKMPETQNKMHSKDSSATKRSPSFFLITDTVLLYDCIIIYLFITLLIDPYIVSSFSLLRKTPPVVPLYIYQFPCLGAYL